MEFLHKKTYFLFFFLVFFSACSDVYSDYQSADNLQWHKADKKTFEFEITEEADYDMFFTMRYISGFPHPVLKVKIEFEGLENRSLEKEMLFKIVDESGKYIGDVAGNMWDFEEIFSEKDHLKPGVYKISFSHEMPKDPVIAVKDLGIAVRKSE